MARIRPKRSYSRGGSFVLTLGLAACATSCTSLDGLTPPSCVFALSSTTAGFDSKGGTGTVAVRTSNSCAWSVATKDTWVSLTSATSGSGDATVSYSVATNGTGAPARNATLSVAGQAFTVSQSGGPSCTYAATPDTAAFLSVGGSGAVIVTTEDACLWTATSQADWVTIQSGGAGAGNGTVNYAVTANMNLLTSRSGTVIVAGHSVTISQAGGIR